jgi:hypothetical protein
MKVSGNTAVYVKDSIGREMHWKPQRHRPDWIRIGEGGSGRNYYILYGCKFFGCEKTKREYPEGI